jgi:uncharacterized Tic20 family protein
MTEANKDARLWGMLAHLSTLSGFVIPMGGIIGPLVVWLIKKEEYPFVDDQGKEALNFQISLFIYTIVCVILAFVVIGIFLLLGLLIFDVVVTIIAAMKANSGEPYRYPLCIRIIK